MKINKIMTLIFAIIMQFMAIMLFMNNYMFLGMMVQILASILFISFGVFLGEYES